MLTFGLDVHDCHTKCYVKVVQDQKLKPDPNVLASKELHSEGKGIGEHPGE